MYSVAVAGPCHYVTANRIVIKHSFEGESKTTTTAEKETAKKKESNWTTTESVLRKCRTVVLLPSCKRRRQVYRHLGIGLWPRKDRLWLHLVSSLASSSSCVNIFGTGFANLFYNVFDSVYYNTLHMVRPIALYLSLGRSIGSNSPRAVRLGNTREIVEE